MRGTVEVEECRAGKRWLTACARCGFCGSDALAKLQQQRIQGTGIAKLGCDLDLSPELAEAGHAKRCGGASDAMANVPEATVLRDGQRIDGLRHLLVEFGVELR